MATSRFACTSCQAVIRSPQPLPVGKLVKCPRCGQVFAVPGEDEELPVLELVPDSDNKPAPNLADGDQPATGNGCGQPATSATHVQATCSQCRYQGNVPARFVGKKVKCPKCQGLFEVADPAVTPKKVAPIASAVAKPPQPAATMQAEPDDEVIDAEAEEEIAAEVEEEEEPAPAKPKRRPFKKKGKPAVGNKMVVGLILCGVSGAVLIVSGVVAALYFGGVLGGSQASVQRAEPVGQASPNPVPSPRTNFTPVPPTNVINPRTVTTPANPYLTFDDWLQDLAQAKAQAAKNKKDIFILFDGSDWCGWSIRLAYEVLFQQDFRSQVSDKFVLVIVDFPRTAVAKAKVVDAARNQRLQKQYRISGYPTVVLADSEGRPYAMLGYKEGGPRAYLAELNKLQEVRVRRDNLLDAVARAEGATKLDAAKAALESLLDSDVAHFYGTELDAWYELACRLDAKNQAGKAEAFFEANWLAGFRRLADEAPEQKVAWVARLDDFKKVGRFKDANRAGLLHLIAASTMARAGQEEQALRYLKDGLAYNPTDQELRQQLAAGAALLGYDTGTALVVAPGGYLLTNAHVISRGKVFVRLPGSKDPTPATVVATDEEHDIALIRVEGKQGAALKPLPIAASRAMARGERVAAFGYPLGDAVGSGLKLTTGVISAVPEKGTGEMLLLDVKVNPGNSGGPLCDAAGNVVGMITAKSASGRGVDSYGMAVPASELDDFLKKNLKGLKRLPAGKQALEWDEVDRRVSASVIMVLSGGR
jgi:S1-C subfamily serine protease